MSRKTLGLTTGIYLGCALIWTVNFVLHWVQDGRIGLSTALYGLSAVCFAIAGVGGMLALRHGRKESDEDKEG